jgi:hypothetical protein
MGTEFSIVKALKSAGFDARVDTIDAYAVRRSVDMVVITVS